MKTHNRLASMASLTVLCLMLATAAVAANPLYDNGPFNPNGDAWTINFGFAVSNSFVLSQASTVTGFTAGLEVSVGDVPETVSYGISATPFGTNLATGTATLTNVPCSGCGPGQYYSTGTISPVNLPAGTYYLTLQNGVTQQGNALYWNENDGVGCTGDNGSGGGCPSVAYENQVGSIGSESFQILGNPGAGASFTVIHNFTGGLDGATPYGGVTLDASGNLYGTTSAGGSGSNGTVYKMTFKNSSWVLSPLYAFRGGQDGSTPTTGVIRDSSGVLYGAAFVGGAHGFGDVFKLSPPATAGGSVTASWNETTLYSFTGGSDGSNPDMIGGNLAFDHAGNLYGTTVYGGLSNCPDQEEGCGTVFKLTIQSGRWTESVIHTFLGSPNDGATPFGDVILDAEGNVYGMTYAGGSNDAPIGLGTVFKLASSGWAESILWNFCGPFSCLDGSSPTGGPVLDNSNNLYGASYNAVLELHGNGVVLYPNLCCAPYGNLIMDAAGNLYGTNDFGGASGYGNVFELSPSGGQYWTYTSLHDFTGGADGAQPFGTLTFDASGNLYGTASQGGTGAGCQGGCGVVFKITP